MEHYDVIIVGGGAAGLFCALTAGRRGRRVLVLEHNERVGRKIEISGGGRCNFTNIAASPKNYISENPAFCRSALARFTPSDFLALVESHGIRWHEKKLGQLFCDDSSRSITGMLLEECARAGVKIRCGAQMEQITKHEKFHIRTKAESFSCDAAVVATGGLSFAKLGATGIGYDIAKHFGLRVTETRPGLVPLVLAPPDLAHFAPLSGTSLPVRATCRGVSFEEAVLLTHRGFSGPVTLQISSYWRSGETIEFDLLPEAQNIPIPSRASAEAQLARVWPRRFAEVWCARYAPQKSVAQWSAKERDKIKCLLRHWSVIFPTSEGYPKAEVTCGGVDTRDISSKTMESRHVAGLYFIGEVVDVTGWLGGYNFQWAWASAHAAGIVV